IRVFASNEAGFPVEDLPPVLRTPHEVLVILLITYSFRDLGDAEIAVSRIGSLDSGLLDLVRGHEVVFQVELDAGSPEAFVWIAHLRGMLLESRIRRLEVEAADSLHRRIAEDRIDEATAHTGAITRARKLRQPSAFLIGI